MQWTGRRSEPPAGGRGEGEAEIGNERAGIVRGMAQDILAERVKGSERAASQDEAVVEGGEIEAAEVFVGEVLTEGRPAGMEGGSQRFGKEGVDEIRVWVAAAVGGKPIETGAEKRSRQ